MQITALLFVSVALSSIFTSSCASSVATSRENVARAPAALSHSQRLCENLRRMELHAHRGASDRPENMLTAFQRAAELGADVIELDLQLSRDSVLVVAHDHWMKEECLDTAGKPAPEKIYYRDMSFAKIQTYDCGSRVKSGQPVPKEQISSLEQILAALRETKTWKARPLAFNIEIKYNPALSPRFFPSRPDYVRLLLKVLDDSRIESSRLLVQSFDIDILKELRRQRPQIRLSALLPDMNPGLQIAQDLKLDLVTPHFSQVTPARLQAFHAQGVQVIPWTVNRPDEALLVLETGTDGVITDQVDLFKFAEKFCAEGPSVDQGRPRDF